MVKVLDNSREATLQDRVVDIISSLISQSRFDGLEFSKVERDYPIGGRRPDIILFKKPNDVPFFIIETKRISKSGNRSSFQVLNPAVVGQAISYIVLYASSKNQLEIIPYFATADPKEIAIFKTPDSILNSVNINAIDKRDYEHVIKPETYTKLINEFLLFYRRLDLSEKFFYGVLDTLAKDFSGRFVEKIKPTLAIINLLRSFVERISEKSETMIHLKMENDAILKSKLKEMGNNLGYIPTSKGLARMMSYVLMNKLIFYKVLEGKFKLPRMVFLDTSSKTKFLEELERYFKKAMEVTKDFEPIFQTGLYDMIDLPDETSVLEVINEFIQILETYSLDEIVDMSGYIYEDLIDPEERHMLGQFYTPHPICELIVKWAIKTPDDVVLDPGCGSGGFLSEAYKELVKLKIGNLKIPPPEGVHQKILDQLYGLDINPFPAHLTAVNIAMKDARSPSTNLNIIVNDFFLLKPTIRIFSSYTVKTVAGEVKREILIPYFDTVIGNPPYTRWNEISENTKNLIKQNLSSEIKKYGLLKRSKGGMRAAQNPGIYEFWIIHASKFLKEHGRIGMIISNSWLQTDYGIAFSQFLLDNFKIKAIIDFSQRLFEIPMVATMILLLERCSNEEERNNNLVKFIYINKAIPVKEILEMVENNMYIEGITFKKILQSKLPKDKKWIEVFSPDIFDMIFKNEKYLKKASDLFKISKGSVKWFIEKGAGTGADPFFYLTPDEVEQWNIEEYVYPALLTARDTMFFSFDKPDWEKIKVNNGKCYMFICHKPRNRLSHEGSKYVKWGERECRNSKSRGGGVICSQATACRQRNRTRGYYGWYDLGDVIPVPIFAIYQARYKTRFVWCKFPVALYHSLISFIPKLEMNEIQIKAILAYLNSSFIQYYVELKGRYIAKGPIGFEVKVAREMPVLDVRKLSNQQLKTLADFFDKLEKETRRIGGASEREQIQNLKPKIYEIDMFVAKILGIPEVTVELVQKQVDMLIERRILGSKKEKSQKIEDRSELQIKPPKKRNKGSSQQTTSDSLDRFIDLT